MLATIEIIANDTTALSTHVLPTKDQLERADVTLWDFLSPRIAAQHTRPVVDPVGDRRSTWWVLAELARRLGHDLAVPTGDDATDDAVLARIGAGGLPLRRPRRRPAGPRPSTTSRPSGWSATSTGSAAGGSPPSCSSTSSRGGARRARPRPAPAGAAPQLAARPTSATRRTSSSTRRTRRPPAWPTAQPVVVRERSQASCAARHGSTRAVRAGAVSVPHGHHDANVNLLTDKDDIDLVTGMARYSGIPSHRRAGGGAAVVRLTTSSGGTARCCSRASPAMIDSTSSTPDGRPRGGPGARS